VRAVLRHMRLAAQSLHRSQSVLGDFCRRMRYRLAPARAMTAVAHKLARIIFRLVTNPQSYDETVLGHNDQKTLARNTRRLNAQAAALSYTLVRLEATLVSWKG
jgi:transposase